MNATSRRSSSEVRSSPDLLIEALSSVFRLLVVLTGIVALMYFMRRSRPIFSDSLISNYFAYYQDLSAAGLVLAIFAAIFLMRTRTPDRTRLPEINGRQIWALAALTTAFCYAGTYWLFGNYGLSMDEFMAGFDAKIIGHGYLFAPVAARWSDYLDALQPIFLMKAPGHLAWSSSYLPGNAAIRALFDMVDAALASPLLAGCSVILIWLVARKLEPGDAEFAAVATLLFVTSSQFLIIAMTPYAMTAHLALNLAWLWLALHDRPWSRPLAVAVSFLACGLHQMVFHPIFVAPFLLWLWLEGKKPQAVLYFLTIAAFSLFWILYWPIGASMALPEVGSEGTHSPAFISHAAELASTAMQPASIPIVFDNLIRLIVWQNPLTWVLVTAACLTFRHQPLVAWILLAGILLTMVILIIVLPFQGHGWGYRYLHGYLGSLALLGAFGWRAISAADKGQPSHLRVTAGLSLIASLFILFPLHAYQAYAFERPYAEADAMLSRVNADLIVIESDGRWYAQDLVRNDPFLRQRPLRLLASNLSAAQAEALCHQYKVAIVGRHSAELSGLRPYGDAMELAPSYLRLLKLKKAGCGDEIDTAPMSQPPAMR
ncbi:MAG TPA: hypothetical protein VJ859_07370 [Allosphingosinicella sp.]|nr:hypothetical protein [Allosphingosinicella sp.]